MAEAPLVAICMATFEPDPRLLERQIASIREQSHERWVCLISDDGSGPEGLAHLRELTAGDERFTLSVGEGRLGFYANFERALQMVPPEADLVALADQDDRWYPEKLAALIAARGDAELVYSDMRIVDEAGGVLSDTFWRDRRNNYTDLASLLLANTVTGAASLFRREVLDLVLPFPEPIGDPFHDQWIAAVALATGRIAYVDRPLYDYVQHGGAARGHAAAMRSYDPRRRLRWRDPRGTIAELSAHAERAYEMNARRIAGSAREIEARAEGLEPEKAQVLRRLARLDTKRPPAGWLAWRSLRRLRGHNETMGIELSLLAAILWRR
ncbi:MAG TPA: glycosyltransferase [Solirubrobacterales bacterium]|nr:glycosyltransferase [Solirubrobacterales bacterium]